MKGLCPIFHESVNYRMHSVHERKGCMAARAKGYDSSRSLCLRGQKLILNGLYGTRTFRAHHTFSVIQLMEMIYFVL